MAANSFTDIETAYFDLLKNDFVLYLSRVCRKEEKPCESGRPDRYYTFGQWAEQILERVEHDHYRIYVLPEFKRNP